MSEGSKGPRLLDVPSAAGLAACVLWAGALLTDRTGEALEWRLFLLLGTVHPLLLVAYAAMARLRPGWTRIAQPLLAAVGVGGALVYVAAALDPRAVLMAAVCTLGEALLPRRGAATGWRAFVRQAVLFATMLAASHGFLRLLWWPSAPPPAVEGHEWLALWLIVLVAGFGWVANEPDRMELGRAKIALWVLATAVLVAASLRVPDFMWERVWHHWGVIVSPAEMVRDGGSLLWDVPAQYGFLSTLSIAAFPGVNAWEAMRLVNAAALAVSALLLFGTLFGVRGGPTGFAAALALSFTAVFLVPGDAEPLWGPFVLPSMGSFRFVWVYVLLAVVAWESRQPAARPGPWIVGSIAFCIGCLWSIESAAYSIATWLPALAWSRYRLARAAHPVSRSIAAGLGATLLPVGLLLVAAVAIRAWYRAVLHIEPDFEGYYEYALSFVQIYAAMPIEPLGPVVGLLALFATLSAALSRAFAGDARDRQVAGLAAFGAAWSTTSYFVSSSRAETADSVMPVWLAAFALVWWTWERTEVPWRMPMVRWVFAAWAACLVFAATYAPRRLEPVGRALIHDPIRPVTPALPDRPGVLAELRGGVKSLRLLMDQAGVAEGDRIVFIFPNLLEAYDPSPTTDEPILPARVWLPMPTILRPLSEERQAVYFDRIHARGIDRGWYIRQLDRPYLGRGYLWKYDLMIDARYEATKSFRNDQWVIEWREPRSAPESP